MTAINEKEYWVSSRKGTCWVKVRNGVIVDTANLWKRFKGQSFSNLKNWLGDVEVKELK